MAASVRRWIEEHTFVPDSDGTGVQLVDDQAARYGEFDEIALVGLIEGEWPDGRSGTFSIRRRCWPRSAGRRKRIAAAPRRRDFSSCSSRRACASMVSTVSLDDEALVEPSTFVDEIPRARLSIAPKESVRRFHGLPSTSRNRTSDPRRTGMARDAGGQVVAGRGRISRLGSGPLVRRRARGRSARSRPISAAHSSFSRSTSSGSRKSPTTKR